jgi:hypothetical protein
VIAYGYLIKRKEARREHLDYIYRGLMTQHAKVHCNTFVIALYLYMRLLVTFLVSERRSCRAFSLS